MKKGRTKTALRRALLFTVPTLLLLACEESSLSSCDENLYCEALALCQEEAHCQEGYCLGNCKGIRPDACESACLPHEQCLQGRCQNTCFPPPFPFFSELPLGSHIRPLEGTQLKLEMGDGESHFLRKDDSLILNENNDIQLEVSWAEDFSCEQKTKLRIPVISSFSASPDTSPSAISSDDPRIKNWAIGYYNYKPGEDLDAEWATPQNALGAPGSSTNEVCSLGNGGELSLVFEEAIGDQRGPDFVVFENAFSEAFLEFAYVEVSSNGVDFTRFPTLSLQKEELGPYDGPLASEVMGLAGRFPHPFGVAFDLADLSHNIEVLSQKVELDRIRFIRIKDIVGDGSMKDSFGQPIYDPFPTHGPAGFDLMGIASLRPSAQ